MANYVKVMLGLPLSNASRNKRELSAAYEAGYRVTVFCGEGGCPEEREELSRYRIILRGPLNAKGGNRVTHRLNILREWYRFGKELAAEKPDVISCHNLTNLFPVWAVTRFMLPRPKLIYDCHEFDLEARGIRGEKEREKRRKRERFLMRRCAFSVMVNDSIAEEVQKIHGLKEKPLVIRSTPAKWVLDADVTDRKRREILTGLQTAGDPFLMMHLGNISTGCGIEWAIRSMAGREHIAFFLVGSIDESYRDELLRLAEECGAGGRVKFHPPVPGNDLWQYAGAADVSIMPVENICRSYYLTLPNKLFESIQSLTPVICSDFPEMARITKEYGIGSLCDPAQPDTLGACLDQMYTDKAFYASCRDSLLRAKEELCWENEKKVLLEAFRRFL